MLNLLLAQLPEGDVGDLVGGLLLPAPADGDAGVHLMAHAGEGREHLEGVQLVGWLAQHSPLQGHHRVGGDDNGVLPRLSGHGGRLLGGQAADQLLGGQAAEGALVHVGGDGLKVPDAHPLQQLLPPGGLGRKNNLHVLILLYFPVEPKPPWPRSVSSRLPHTSSRAWTTGITASWAMRSPGATV